MILVIDISPITYLLLPLDHEHRMCRASDFVSFLEGWVGRGGWERWSRLHHSHDQLAIAFRLRRRCSSTSTEHALFGATRCTALSVRAGGLCLPGAFKAAGLIVPDSSMTPRCTEGNDEELGCDTANITSRYLACAAEAVLLGRTAHPRPQPRRVRCAPVAVRNWRYSVARGRRCSMDGGVVMLARALSGWRRCFADRRAARSQRRNSVAKERR